MIPQKIPEETSSYTIKAMVGAEEHEHTHLWASTWITDFFDPKQILSILDKANRIWEERANSFSDSNDGYDLSFIFGYLFFIIIKFFIPFVIVLGLLGNIASVLVFLRTILHKFTYSYYFAAFLLCECVYLIDLLLVWLDSNHYISIFNTYGVCHIISYTSAVSSSLTVWYITAAVIESYLAIKEPFRNQGNSKICETEIFLFLLLWVFAVGYSFVLYSIVGVDLGQFYKIKGFEVLSPIDGMLCVFVPFLINSYFITKILMKIEEFRRRIRRAQTRIYDYPMEIFEPMDREILPMNAEILRILEDDILQEDALNTTRQGPGIGELPYNIMPSIPREDSTEQINDVVTAQLQKTSFPSEPTSETVAEHTEPEQTNYNLAGCSSEPDKVFLINEKVIYFKKSENGQDLKVRENEPFKEENSTASQSEQGNDVEVINNYVEENISVFVFATESKFEGNNDYTYVTEIISIFELDRTIDIEQTENYNQDVVSILTPKYEEYTSELEIINNYKHDVKRSLTLEFEQTHELDIVENYNKDVESNSTLEFEENSDLEILNSFDHCAKSISTLELMQVSEEETINILNIDAESFSSFDSDQTNVVETIANTNFDAENTLTLEVEQTNELESINNTSHAEENTLTLESAQPNDMEANNPQVVHEYNNPLFEANQYDSLPTTTTNLSHGPDMNGGIVPVENTAGAKMILAVVTCYFVLTLPCYFMRLYMYIGYEIWSAEVPTTLISIEQVFTALQYLKLSVNVLLFNAHCTTFRYFFVRYFKINKLICIVNYFRCR